MMDLTQEELYRLADYNAEVARGIVHTERWKEYMAKLQWRFEQEHQSNLHADLRGVLGLENEG